MPPQEPTIAKIASLKCERDKKNNTEGRTICMLGVFGSVRLNQFFNSSKTEHK